LKLAILRKMKGPAHVTCMGEGWRELQTQGVLDGMTYQHEYLRGYGTNLTDSGGYSVVGDLGTQ
jgi:hypothetical protein